MSSAADRIILFLKVMRPGRVKTRLAAELGREAALEVYAALVADLMTRLQPLRGNLVPYWDTEPALSDLPHPLNDDHVRQRAKVQRGEDLGKRMANAFAEQFAAGAQRALLIGSDIPGIGARLLEGYLESLRSHPMVLGPAADGGYYLIGFTRQRFHRTVFDDVEWSTGRVFDQTRARARSLGLDCCVGETLQDLDTLEDLQTLSASGALSESVLQVLRRYRSG